MPPQVIVHGLYRIPCNEPMLKAQLLDYYRRAGNAHWADVSAFVERVFPLVLMDMSISGADERFELGEFTQEMSGAPREAWQVPYDEALLSGDGNAVLVRKIGCATKIGEGRIAFFFHYYDPEQPMRWTYGRFSCPTPQAAVQSLLSLIPYEPI
jgi:hypothetical protein